MFSLINPGALEVYCGPMKCGKSRHLLLRVDQLPYANIPYIFFKPETDTRDGNKVASRFGELSYESNLINSQTPNLILDFLSQQRFTNQGLVLIDEVQFFDPSVVSVVDNLVRRGYNVVAAGLDLDFRGEPFGPMPALLARADLITKLRGICEFKNCRNPGTRTQRLIDGKPAPYNAPIVSVDGATKNEIYQCSCLAHHSVPGKP